MHIRSLKITDRRMERFGDTWRFRVRGEGGSMTKGILFEQMVPNHELNQEKLDEVNEGFRNSLRYVKHYGGYPDASATEADMKAALDQLSSTDYGIGIKIRQDPLTEFEPFTL